MDLNEDGHPDILSGSYSRSGGGFMAGLFQVLWGTKEGAFKKAEPLKGTDGELLVLPLEGSEDKNTPRICTRPFAVDWDGDGDLDIVSGNFAGTLFVFEGEGDGKFAPKAKILEEADTGKPLKITGVHSDPFVIDFDGDKDLDILSGSGAGGVQIAVNTAGPGKEPTFNGFEELVAAPKNREKGFLKRGEVPAAPGGSTRVWVSDLNEDGKPDLLLGDSVTLRYPADGMTAEEVTKKEAAWSQSLNDLMSDRRAAGADAEAQQEFMQKYQALREEREKFLTEERTGFVWAYLQK